MNRRNAPIKVSVDTLDTMWIALVAKHQSTAIGALSDPLPLILRCVSVSFLMGTTRDLEHINRVYTVLSLYVEGM